MAFQYTFRSDDITTWDADTRDLMENRDRELELYSTTIDTSFLNLNASNLTSGTVPSARMTGAYTGITSVGTLGSLTVTGDVTVDTNTLRVDSTNNRVGINVTSPSSTLDIVGNQVIRAAATQDGIQLAGRAGGTTSLTSKLIPTTLTANRTLTLPDVDGTLITTGNLSSITAVGTLTSGSIPASLLTGTTLPATIVSSSLTSVGTLTGLSSSGSISISRGSLGTTSGNSLTFINPNALTSNGDSLNLTLNRTSNGTDWQTAAWKFQRLVDATTMGYAAFGYYNWDLGVNTTSYLSGSSITGVVTAGVPISGYSFLGTNSGNQNNYVKLGTNAIDSTTVYGYTAYGNLRTTCGYGTGVSWYSNGAASPSGFVPNVHASFWASGTNSGDIRSNANNTTAYNTTSDYRLKKNIVDIDDAIKRIRLLHPVKFEFKDPSNDIVYDGFLAHEVQSVAPYAVSGEKDAIGDNGQPMYQQIDTSWLVGLLTAGIQDLDQRLQQLENT